MAATNIPGARPPLVLSDQLVAAVESGRLPYDLLIEGIPFRLKPSQQDPYVRQILSGEKDQFDSSREAGENSFGDWWLRSQATFSGGAGQKYIDSGESSRRDRYLESSYLFPHEPGELTIAGLVASTPGTQSGALQVTRSGAQKLVTAYTNTFKIRVWDLPGLGGASDVNIGATGIPAAIATDGVNVFVAINDRVYRVNSANTVTLIHSTDIPFTGPVALGFAKQRLILCVGPKVWELDPNPGVTVTAHTAHYINPASEWAYTAIAEGPNGIYLAGFSGPDSNVSSMTVAESAGTVVLGPPVVQLRLPPSEVARALLFYVGSLFALGTSNGVRVGSFTPYGQPQLGRLLLRGTPCRALAASGTLIWVGADDSLWWVDLSTPVDQAGGYAYARHATSVGATSADYVNALTVYPAIPDRAFGTTSTGRLLSQPAYVPTTGTLTTSWVRFDTTEPKRLHYVAVEGDLPAVPGVPYVLSMTVEASTGESKTFNIEGGGTNYEFSISESLPTAQAFRIVFTLNDSGGDHKVSLRSWQMKARPVPRRQPEVVVPLMLADHEQAVRGEKVGWSGFAAERLLAIQQLAATGQQVTVRDQILGISYQAEIGRFQFRQDAPPSRTNGTQGVINIVFRLV